MGFIRPLDAAMRAAGPRPSVLIPEPEPPARGAQPPASQSDYIDAATAMQLLKVRAQTLYAYVSRGWIRSVAQPGKKAKRYHSGDVERLRKRSEARAGHGAVAAAAMDWGQPILPTSITEITPQGPAYRGHPAAGLVRAGTSVEAVSELLWTGKLPDKAPRWRVRAPAPALLALARSLSASDPAGNVLEVFAMATLLLGIDHGSTEQRLARGGTLAAGREIMQAMVGFCGFIGPGRAYRPMQARETLLQALTASLGMSATAENTEVLRALLILLADHELPPGTLSARVVASAGGSLQSCLAAALCATSGVELGRMYARVETLIGKGARRATLVRRACQRLEQGQAIPGFHHPLYPAGDPRAALLLDMIRKRATLTRELRAVFSFLDEVERITGLRPRQELAVVVVTRALQLAPQAAPALFALARIAGWIAHVQEQRATSMLLRPRAKFVAGGSAR